MNIGIYIYENAEVLDFSGPFEVFSAAKRLNKALSNWNIRLIADSEQWVRARGGMVLQSHWHFGNCPQLDVLIVVGGDHRDELQKTHVIEWIRQQSRQAQTVASVCTGAFLLAEAGCLDNLTVTTHWEDCEVLQSAYPLLTVNSDKRFIDAGKFITSGGIAAGIDMSLFLLAQLTSQDLADRTARQMEYDWEY